VPGTRMPVAGGAGDFVPVALGREGVSVVPGTRMPVAGGAGDFVPVALGREGV
jgi:hypothetical protein